MAGGTTPAGFGPAIHSCLQPIGVDLFLERLFGYEFHRLCCSDPHISSGGERTANAGRELSQRRGERFRQGYEVAAVIRFICGHYAVTGCEGWKLGAFHPFVYGRHLAKSISHSIEVPRRSRGTSPTADDCQAFALSAVFGRSADNTSYQHWGAAESRIGCP